MARGAISLNIPTGCDIAGGWIDAPAVAGGHPVTASGPTQVITDGEALSTGSANVNCGYLGASASTADVSINSIAGGVSFDMGAPLTVGQPMECTLTVSPAAGQVEGLAPDPACTCTALSAEGSAFLVQIQCANLTTDAGDMNCALTEGYIYFDGCE